MEKKLNEIVILIKVNIYFQFNPVRMAKMSSGIVHTRNKMIHTRPQHPIALSVWAIQLAMDRLT